MLAEMRSDREKGIVNWDIILLLCIGLGINYWKINVTKYNLWLVSLFSFDFLGT